MLESNRPQGARVRAVRMREPGGPEVLEFGTTEIGRPDDDELLVDVFATGVNRADLLQRKGLYPAPPGVDPAVLGLEYAGQVAFAGKTSGHAVGDRVMGIVPGGAMAEQVLVQGREALPVPSTLTWAQAGAVPEAFLTAFDALFQQTRLAVGETLLVHAAASGVGTAALQLARLTGAIGLGTTRTDSKLARIRECGASDALKVVDGKFADWVLEKTEQVGADVVLDLVGGPYVTENLRALSTKGRWVMVGLMGGRTAELDLGQLLRKRVRLVGTVLRSRPPEEKAALAQKFRRHALGAFVTGVLSPVVDTVLPVEEVAEAHRRLESNETSGKIVLTWREAADA